MNFGCFQWKFANSQSEWCFEERRPGCLWVSNNSVGGGEQVGMLTTFSVCIHPGIFCKCWTVSSCFIHLREKYLQWEKSYESLSEFVVPRSSRWVSAQVQQQALKLLLSASRRSKWEQLLNYLQKVCLDQQQGGNICIPSTEWRQMKVLIIKNVLSIQNTKHQQSLQFKRIEQEVSRISLSHFNRSVVSERGAFPACHSYKNRRCSQTF